MRNILSNPVPSLSDLLFELCLINKFIQDNFFKYLQLQWIWLKNIFKLNLLSVLCWSKPETPLIIKVFFLLHLLFVASSTEESLLEASSAYKKILRVIFKCYRTALTSYYLLCSKKDLTSVPFQNKEPIKKKSFCSFLNFLFPSQYLYFFRNSEIISS